MSELEDLQEKLNDLKHIIMRENCYIMLKDFLFYFKVDQKKEDVLWTENVNVLKMMEQIEIVLESERERFSKYYELKSDFVHLNSGSHGHSHSHGHNHDHNHDK